MSVTKAEVEAALARVQLPDGKSLLSHDLVRALVVEGDKVRFVIEAPNADVARQMAPLRDAAEQVVRDLPGWVMCRSR
nr:iron-sulfur cluster assembly protein [Sulfitobacter faviae]